MNIEPGAEEMREVVNQSIKIEPSVIPAETLSQDQDKNTWELTNAKISSGENEATEYGSASRKLAEPEDEQEERTSGQGRFREDKRRATWRPSDESTEQQFFSTEFAKFKD